MRTTLNIDDDVLIAVKELARRDSKSLGDVMSSLLRQSLTHGHADGRAKSGQESEFGFRPFPKRGGIITNELIDRLREEAGD
ncbi:MAG: hypothetical protein OXC15_09150 [Rhodospirillaceae bacterium]|nr:hypothetical protein [Rhodospirillaceae bacterium]